MTLEEITEMVVHLNIDDIADGVKKHLDQGAGSLDVLDALSAGMEEVGRLYEEKEYFLAELVLAGETMKEAMSILEPHLKSADTASKEKVIVATVKGDNHDIGKNILGTMLMSAGFDVIDLGMDCPAERIVEAVRESNTHVIALSCLLTMTMQEISVVNDTLRSARLRDDVKIIVGGAPLTMELAREMGADDYGADAIDGVRRIKALTGV